MPVDQNYLRRCLELKPLVKEHGMRHPAYTDAVGQLTQYETSYKPSTMPEPLTRGGMTTEELLSITRSGYRK